MNKVLAEADIKSLVVGERYFRDSGQWDKLRKAYHPDASKTSINITWYTGDVDGFVGGSMQMASKGSTSMHTITPVEIEINGSKAFSVSVGSINARFMHAESEYELVSNCRFLSRLQRIDGPDGQEWKMLTMEVIYINDMIVPVVPRAAGSSGFDFKHIDGGARKSYRYLAWLLAQRGHTVNNDLPGIDDEKSVKEVMDRSHEWLHA